MIIKFIQENDLKDKKVLNIGCGETDYSEVGFNFINIDKLDWTKKYPVKNFIQCDAVNMPFKEEFDGVICCDILEHAEDPQAVLKECYRVLKKEGKILITVPFQFQPHGDEGEIKYPDFWRFTADGLSLITKKAGFKIEICSYSFLKACIKVFGQVNTELVHNVRVNLIGIK